MQHKGYKMQRLTVIMAVGKVIVKFSDRDYEEVECYNLGGGDKHYGGITIDLVPNLKLILEDTDGLFKLLMTDNYGNLIRDYTSDEPLTQTIQEEFKGLGYEVHQVGSNIVATIIR